MVAKTSRLSLLETACLIFVPVIWGVQFVVIKLGLAAFPPLLFVALRFAAAAAMLLPFVGVPTRRDLLAMLLISIFLGGLNFGLFFAGLAHGSAGVSAVVNQLSAPFAVLLAWPLLGERPSSRVLIGLGLALCGVVMTVAQPGMAAPVVPTVLVIGAGLAWAVGNVLTSRYGPFKPLRLMAWMSLLAVPQMLAASFLTEHGQLAAVRAAGAEAWLAFAYTVVLGVVVGWSVWFWLIARLSMARVAPFAMLQIVAAIGAGAILLREPVTPLLIGGAALCILGVVMTQGKPGGGLKPSIGVVQHTSGEDH